MAIIKLLSIYFVFSFMPGCIIEKEINMEKLRINSTENGYVICVDTHEIIQLINDTSNITALIFKDNERVNVDFYITPPYLSSAYFSHLDNIGQVLILESFPVGASGLSANITNVSIVALDKNIAWKTLSYNSFYGGVDLLKYFNGEVFVDIYDYNGFTKDNDIQYCKNSFKLSKGGFVPGKLPECFTQTDKGLMNQKDCSCSQLQTPYVYK